MKNSNPSCNRLSPIRSKARMLILGPLALAVLPQSAWSESAADALLNAAGPAPTAGESSSPGYIRPSTMATDEIKLSSPVARQVFADWMANSTQSYELNAWVKGFLKDQFEATAHLWSAMQSRIHTPFYPAAQAAYLDSLKRLDLPQTFFNAWMGALSSPDFAASKAATALEETLSSDFDSWIISQSIQVSADHEAVIRRLSPSRSPVFASLTALISLRQGEAGAELLPKLPVNSEFRPLLAQTAAISLAKRGDIANAARVLKTYYEPWLLREKNAEKLAVYYLQIARLLYQAGSLEAAVSYYSKVPTGMPQYLIAREELSWCWLRLGDTERLRGNLETLTSRAVADHFQPEAYLVRAISNLKLCYYSEVDHDFTMFLEANRRWAKEIGSNLASVQPKAPRTPDLFAVRANARVESRKAERAVLAKLSERSISAVLPAVGPQKHWTTGLDQNLRDTDQAEKSKIAEFRRQWSNDRQTLGEAIRKMQFVKVELLSQVVAARNDEKDQILTGQSAPIKGVEAKPLGDSGDLTFPFDGVIWPDELFKLRARARGRCLGQ